MSDEARNPLTRDADEREVNPHDCPYCGRPNNTISYAGTVGDVPQAKEGDLSVCWGCRRIARFQTSPLGLIRAVAVTEAEERAFRASPQMRAILGSLDLARSPSEGARVARRKVGRE